MESIKERTVPMGSVGTNDQSLERWFEREPSMPQLSDFGILDITESGTKRTSSQLQPRSRPSVEEGAISHLLSFDSTSVIGEPDLVWRIAETLGNLIMYFGTVSKLEETLLHQMSGHLLSGESENSENLEDVVVFGDPHRVVHVRGRRGSIRLGEPLLAAEDFVE